MISIIIVIHLIFLSFHCGFGSDGRVPPECGWETWLTLFYIFFFKENQKTNERQTIWYLNIIITTINIIIFIDMNRIQLCDVCVCVCVFISKLIDSILIPNFRFFSPLSLCLCLYFFFCLLLHSLLIFPLEQQRKTPNEKPDPKTNEGVRARIQTEGDAGAAREDAHGRASLRLPRLPQEVPPAVASGPALEDTLGRTTLQLLLLR